MKVKYFFLIFIVTISCKQTDRIYSGFNLDFEKVENGIPHGWDIYPSQQSYLVSLDSTHVKSGKYSIAIEFVGDSVGFQLLLLTPPDHYDGEKITLSGYIKAENVTDGYAGLCMRIDPQTAVDEMRRNGVTGTTDWKKYEITLDMNPAQAQRITFGGLLAGKGKMWLDDLKVSIDGKDIEKIQPVKPEPFSEKAKNDREFDQGSNIVFPEQAEQKIEDLELLGRIWGFMKYHHPAIAKGNYNWDNELFRILPVYLNANNHQQRDKILLKWINKYGRIPKCKTCRATPDSAFLKPDLSWIEHGDIDLKLKDLLHEIYLNRNQGNHYYVDTHSRGIPLFTNERTYEAMDCPDTGFRLLALYRYWNMIHYFSPYKYLTDKDWNTVLPEYIPYFIEAANKRDYRLTATLLIAEVCDSHSVLYGEPLTVESSNTDLQVPALVQFVENKLVVMDHYAGNARLKKGDIITHIHGKPVEAIVDSMKKYFPASNEAVKMRDIAREILRFNRSPYIRLDSGNNPYIDINYLSPDHKTGQKEIWLDSRDMWMYHRHRKEDTARSYRYTGKGKDIGYITLKTIKSDDVPIIKKEFINTKGIIIDIRNYPASSVVSLGEYFVSNTVPFVKFTKGNSDNPGEFIFKDISSIHKPKETRTYQGKLVVIVNEETQSHAEYMAMAFRAGDHTTIIGSQTAGADGNVSEIVLPGGLKTRISGIGVYYPDGRETQRVGIIPDIEVKPTIQGIREGRDEVLEKAIEIIK
jgi:C-terminal processing protease CtpA/Prc